MYTYIDPYSRYKWIPCHLPKIKTPPGQKPKMNGFSEVVSFSRENG